MGWLSSNSDEQLAGLIGWIRPLKRLAACVGKEVGATECELPQRTSRPVRFRPRACHKSKMPRDFDAASLRDSQRSQLQFLRDCPTRNETDAETGLNRGFDGF